MKCISKEEYPFILYNNRSLELVKRFVDWKKYRSNIIVEIEKRLSHFQLEFNHNKEILIETNDLNIDCNDVLYSKKDLQNLTTKFNNSVLLDKDRLWLNNRNINNNIIEKYNMKSLSVFKSNKELEILGATKHPLLNDLLEDGLEGGGIMIPFYENNLLSNVTIRKIDDVGKLKYTQSCPDVSVYGLNSYKGEELWLCEGLFDMMSLHYNQAPAVSVSSAMWSSLQIYQILELGLKNLFIFVDNDKAGLRSARILQKLFSSYNINTKTFKSSKAKDPAEHFLELNLEWSDLELINITKEMIDDKPDQTFNFTKYLKNRKF